MSFQDRDKVNVDLFLLHSSDLSTSLPQPTSRAVSYQLITFTDGRDLGYSFFKISS